MKKCPIILIVLLFFSFNLCAKIPEPVRILILSGRNNHNWKQTTKQLERIFSDTERYAVSITMRPDTLKLRTLEQFNVVLNNWNSWPENDIRWTTETERALSDFIKTGGGFVTFHSSTSVFYKWPEFGDFTTAEWIDSTWHKEKSATHVIIGKSNHPVTSGMNDFYIYDELWVNAGKNDRFQILGAATNLQLKEDGVPVQPAIMVSDYGKGRIFHTILGHDARAMRNLGFKTLIRRGTEWAATGKVISEIPQELRKPEKHKQSFSWVETDTTIALLKGKDIVWQYNFNTKYGRPFFHPVFVDRNNITCVSPDDHLWHLGQWFCWKYINKVNYWEYKKGTLQSEGVTKIENIEIKKNSDFSAEIRLHIVYHPEGKQNVLSEDRVVRVSPPQRDGRISMDYDFLFKALEDQVELNRTPILGQKNGKSWGGYAGLSVRFNQDFMDSGFITPRGTIMTVLTVGRAIGYTWDLRVLMESRSELK